MKLASENIARLRGLVEGAPQNVVIVSHTNPDGDAIGSSLAWASLLRRHGHRVTCMVPNRYPVFLEWMPEIADLRVFKLHPAEVAAAVEAADTVYCLDFNQIHRLDGIGELIEGNPRAQKVLIDHHLDPPHIYDLEISYPTSSSTCYLVYRLIEEMFGVQEIDRTMAEQLYVGIMTDTGNFSFSFLTAELFRAVAVLIEKGVDIPHINRMIYNSFTADRLRLLGYALSKMEITTVAGNDAAWITLDEAELRRFNFHIGDSEGFVNYPLSIRGLALSAMMIETRNFIRISLRSRPDVDASAFARRYFEGGGHKNAAGGKSFDTLAVTVERYKKAVEEFFAEHAAGGGRE
jgi:phosphoesterase RecJ-like protein